MTPMQMHLIVQALLIVATLLWKWANNESGKNAFLWWLTLSILWYGVFFIKWFIFWKGAM